MEKWNCKTVVITGANSGIGLATLNKLAKAGMKTVGFDLQTDNIEKVVKDYDGKVLFQQVDVCDYEALRRAFRYVDDMCGGVDVLINNAGIMRKGNILEDGDENMDGILKTVDTNYAGVVRCCHLAYDFMKRKDYGYVINVNSVDGHYVPRNVTTNTYCGSKHAVTALSDVLRKELIQMRNNRIRITSISPGAVDTDFFNNCTEEMQKEMYDNHKLKPDDVADAIEYLLSTPNSVNVTELTLRALGSPASSSSYCFLS